MPIFDTPLSNVEAILQNALGAENEVVPQSRVEELLDRLDKALEDIDVGTAVEAWMEENVTGGEQVTDMTLTLPGVPADAKKTGDEIGALKEDLSVVSGRVTTRSFDNESSTYIKEITNIYLNAGESVIIDSNGSSNATVKIEGSSAEAIMLPANGSFTFTADTAGYLRFYYKKIHAKVRRETYIISSNFGSSEYLAASQSLVTQVNTKFDPINARLNEIDALATASYELGGIGSNNNYVTNNTQIRTPQGQALHLHSGDTITISDGAKIYLRGTKMDSSVYDGVNWKTGVYTVTEEANYLIVAQYGDSRVVTDVSALASMLAIRTTTGNTLLKAQTDINAIYETLGSSLAFYGYRGTIDAVENEKSGGVYPHIYSADSVTFTKTELQNYAGIEMRINKFAIGSTIAVQAYRDIESTAFMIRIDFYGSDDTRVAPEVSTKENVLRRVIPDGTNYIVVTLPTNWGKALDVGTVATFSNISIYYSDIEDLRDENGNTTYTGEKVVLTNDNPKEHLCTVNQWLEYSETDLIAGLTTDKAFYKNQSMTIYGGYIFFFSENGGGFVADYETKTILSEFNTEPTSVNHNNSAEFSDIYHTDGDEFPLLFVSRCGNAAYQSGEHDFDEVLIYRVIRNNTAFTFTLINSIKLNVQTYGLSWGVDNVRHMLYAYAPINGNWQVQTGNYCDFWAFDMPAKAQILSGTTITLDSENSAAHFRHDYFTAQGCAVNGGRLFVGISSGMQWIWVVDVLKGKILSKIPITNIAELEGVAIYNDKIYTTHKNSTNLYMFEASF